MLQNAAPLRKSAPWPPNSSDEHVSCTAPATEMHLCRSSSNVPRLPSFLEMLQNPHVLLTFDKVHNPLRLPRETTSERQKVLRTRQLFPLLTSKCALHRNGVHFFDISTSKSALNRSVFTLLTSKCASRHNGVHFFDISTSKSALNRSVLCTFDFEMCFAPQRRALFWHLNFKKPSEAEVLCTFWLGSVLRATTACNFSSLIWPAGSAPAPLASLLFDPPEPQIIGKTLCLATFLPFRAPGSSFFGDFLFFDLLSSSLLFSDSSHLCFSSVHIVGSLTTKLPSMITCK